LNLASLWQLPSLIVLEDNGWSQSTPSQLNLAGSMRARFEAFGIEVESRWALDPLVIHGRRLAPDAGARIDIEVSDAIDGIVADLTAQ
jgi:hypothetical protein